MGWPWSFASTPGGGNDNYPDGCSQIYDRVDNKMVYRSGTCAGVRPPLVNQDLDWKDRDGVWHKGISAAEREALYEMFGKTGKAQNSAATAEQLAAIRSAPCLGLRNCQQADSTWRSAPDLPINPDQTKPQDTAGVQPKETTPGSKATADSGFPVWWLAATAAGAWLIFRR